MLKFCIKNVSTKIVGYIEEEIYKALDDAMSYQIQGAEFSDKYQSGQWDGYKRLFRKHTRTFPTGMLGIAADIASKHGVAYEIEDLRVRPKAIQKFSLKQNKVPRKYQLEAAQKSLIYGRGIIEVATGGGKSFIITMIAARLGLPTVIYVNTKDLLYQMYDNLKNIDTVDDIIGQIGDGIVKPGLITVAMIQSVYKSFGERYPKFDEEDAYSEEKELSQDEKQTVISTIQKASVMIIDETQFLASDTFQLVANHSANAYYRYGLSVGGDSLVYVKNSESMELIDLEKLFNRTDGVTGKFRDLPNYEVRSFNGSNFEWKSVKGILKHKLGSKKAFRIYSRRGHTLTITEDHSIYKLNKFKIEEVLGIDLRIGDFILSDYPSNKGSSVEIKKIEETKPEYVYDISVDSSEWPCFVANGILVHNSATPYRTDNADIMLTAATGQKYFNISASYLIDNRYLVAPDITMIHLPREESKIHLPREESNGTSYQNIYKLKVAESEVSNNTIVDIAKFFYDRDMSVLILVQHISHGETLIAKLKTKIEFKTVEEIREKHKKPMRLKDIEFLRGQVASSKRKKILELFKTKKIKIVVATTLADCGLDIPSLDVLIVAGRGKSITRVPQRIGRVIRTSPEKDRAFVFDFYDTSKYLLRQSREREEIYATEPRFRVHHFRMNAKTKLEQYLKALLITNNSQHKKP